MIRLPPALYAGLWAAGLAAFMVMAAFAAAEPSFPSDVWLAQRLQDVGGGLFPRLLDYTEDLVQVPLVAVVTVVAAAGFYLVAGRQAAVLVIATLLARPLNSGLKEIVGRPRPSSELVEFDSQPADPSFPSGHANNAMLLFGVIIYLAAVYIPNPKLRYPVQALSLWAIVGNGLERVYAGHHWPSDVIGGFLLGALLLALFIAVHRTALAPRAAVTNRHPVRS